MTEHLFRFRQAEALLGGFWSDDRVPAALAGVDGRLLGFPRHGRPRCVRALRPGGQGRRAPRRHRPGGRLLPGADGPGGRPAGRVPLRRAAGLGALAGRLALRRHRRPPADGRVVGPPGGRLLGGVHPGPRGAGGLGRLRRPGPSRPDQGGGVRARRPGRVVGPHGRGGGIVGHGGGALLGGLAQAGGGAVPGAAAPPTVRRPRRAPHHGLRRPPPRAGGRPGGGVARPARRGRRRHVAGLPGPGAAPGRRGQPAPTERPPPPSEEA